MICIKWILSMVFLVAFTGYLEAQPVKKDTFQLFGCLFPEGPKFPGGDDSLRSYIQRNVKRPNPKDFEPKATYVKFKIDCKGNISNISILRGTDSLFNKEVLRVIKQMPKWVPETCDTFPEAVWWNLPVRIKE